ncbi:uncharacterized protein LOC113750133 [Coffea eugenioides]|uniref:uncharacterized protein LOC113750133 n=1 Tax=Coffea eugenioides TaxID=49369 RepID=UPI000F60BC86|nr:uncharacterized protein LOC113750133 [Coffea eugenioides]
MSGSFFLGSLTSRGLITKPSSCDKYTRRRGLFLNPGSNLGILAPQKNPMYFLGHQSLIHLSHEVQRKNERQRNFAVYNSVQPEVPPPSGPPSSDPLKGWIIGIVLTVVIPFLVQKCGKTFLRLENKVVAVVEKVEDAVEGVEKVAEKVEKVAENVADHLPEGELKNAAIFVEKVADRVDDTAEVVEKTIDKVEEVEEEAESAVESALEKKDAVPNEAKETAKELKK